MWTNMAYTFNCVCVRCFLSHWKWSGKWGQFKFSIQLHMTTFNSASYTESCRKYSPNNPKSSLTVINLCALRIHSKLCREILWGLSRIHSIRVHLLCTRRMRMNYLVYLFIPECCYCDTKTVSFESFSRFFFTCATVYLLRHFSKLNERKKNGSGTPFRESDPKEMMKLNQMVYRLMILFQVTRHSITARLLLLFDAREL